MLFALLGKGVPRIRTRTRGCSWHGRMCRLFRIRNATASTWTESLSSPALITNELFWVPADHFSSAVTRSSVYEDGKTNMTSSCEVRASNKRRKQCPPPITTITRPVVAVLRVQRVLIGLNDATLSQSRYFLRWCCALRRLWSFEKAKITIYDICFLCLRKKRNLDEKRKSRRRKGGTQGRNTKTPPSVISQLFDRWVARARAPKRRSSVESSRFAFLGIEFP